MFRNKMDVVARIDRIIDRISRALQLDEEVVVDRFYSIIGGLCDEKVWKQRDKGSNQLCVMCDEGSALVATILFAVQVEVRHCSNTALTLNVDQDYVRKLRQT